MRATINESAAAAVAVSAEDLEVGQAYIDGDEDFYLIFESNTTGRLDAVSLGGSTHGAGATLGADTTEELAKMLSKYEAILLTDNQEIVLTF